MDKQMKIKNWSEFQHFKDRTPPWIKLYRYLLDDPDWHELSGDDAKTLIMLWLLASEDKEMEGNIPDIKKTAFRLRISESKLKQSLNKLSNWLIQDDINMISECYQLDAPETETETETETEERHNNVHSDFLIFWQAYPKKVGKDAAYKLWAKLRPRIDDVMFALSWQRESKKWQEGYIPNPTTYLNQGRWKDEPDAEMEGDPF